MNNLLSYCWLVDPRISASDKNLPVQQSKSSVPSISKDVLKFRVSQFLHSCRPNVVTENYLENYEVRAITKIKAGQQIRMSRYIGNDPVFCMNPLETRQWRLHQGNEVQQIVVTL